MQGWQSPGHDGLLIMGREKAQLWGWAGGLQLCWGGVLEEQLHADSQIIYDRERMEFTMQRFVSIGFASFVALCPFIVLFVFNLAPRATFADCHEADSYLRSVQVAPTQDLRPPSTC